VAEGDPARKMARKKEGSIKWVYIQAYYLHPKDYCPFKVYISNIFATMSAEKTRLY
jgi:hypothetical protein